MKICPHCGNAIKNDLAKFCGKCGTKQPEIAPQKEEIQEQAVVPASNEITVSQPPHSMPNVEDAPCTTPPPIPTTLLAQATPVSQNVTGGDEQGTRPSSAQNNPETQSQTSSKKWIVWVVMSILILVILVVYGLSWTDDSRLKISGTSEYYSVEDTVGANYIICTAGGVSFKMIHVEGGSFEMGENGTNSNEKPEHRVILPDYYIGQTEVTQELWEAVMEDNPSHFQDNPSHPVESVSWIDCQQFVRKLSNITGRNFSLPTEAQWEFAARGGNKSQGYTYSGSDYLNNVAWFGYYNGGNAEGKTSPVKLKEPNELGLYDMSGNVWEWCQDEYDEDYYYHSPTYDPKCTSGDGQFVLRGGSWYSNTELNRVAYRGRNKSNCRDSYLGLRLVLSNPKEDKKQNQSESKSKENQRNPEKEMKHECPNCGPRVFFNTEKELENHLKNCKKRATSPQYPKEDKKVYKSESMGRERGRERGCEIE